MYPTMVSVAIMKQESSDSSVRVYGSQLKWRKAVRGSIGQKILKTDHMNLTYINVTFTGKVLRWKMYLQDKDFDLYHVAGK